MPLFPPTTELPSLRVTSIDAAGIPVVVQHAPGSGMDMQRWQDSNGVVQAKIRHDGLVATSFVRNLADNGPYFYLAPTFIQVVSAGTGHVPLVVQGAAGQLASLQIWQDSAGVPSMYIRADRALQFYSAGDELNSGVIMARPAFAPNSLCLIGSGTTASNRNVYIFDTLGVSGNIDSTSGNITATSGNITASSGIVTGAWGTFTNYINLATSVADKMYFYDGGGVNAYGLGIQSSRLVAFVPAAAAFSFRATQPSVPQSGGVDLVAIFGDGRITQTLTAAGSIALTIQGAATQTADFIRLQDSAAGVRAKINAAGTLFINPGSRLDSGIIITAFASNQTAPLEEWRDYLGNAMAAVSAVGNISIGNTIDFGAGVGVLALKDAATAPTTNPAGGGVLYSQGGHLKWRGPSGVIAIAAPSFVTGNKFSTD